MMCASSPNTNPGTEIGTETSHQPNLHVNVKKNHNLTALRVSANGRYLETSQGVAFFWLGDTAWELLHRLNREESEHYLRTRAEQRFTVIQTVLLAEFSGITTENAYGRLPLYLDEQGLPDSIRPDSDGVYSYWHHVDAILELAASQGLYVALLPTWGDKFNQKWGKGPEMFTPENAFSYGKWLGERYGSHPQVIWVLGGDRPLETKSHFDVVTSMARGLKEGGAMQLMTFHPPGCDSSSRQLHDELWLDFNMIQSGHGEREITNDWRVRQDYERKPVKPTLDAEPCYEDIPIGFRGEQGYFDATDVRKAAYYALFSGAFGHTYGHHSIWSMYQGTNDLVDSNRQGDYFIMTWREALHRPGAAQMKHVRTLLEQELSSDLRPNLDLIHQNRAGENRAVSLQNKYSAYIYLPNGLYVDVVMGYIEGKHVKSTWFCPRTGETIEVSSDLAILNQGIERFTAPTSGRGNDWILILKGV
nr:glycoside hydrolase family 140 protein [Paenibacillus xylanexedens]